MTKKADTWMPWYVADYLADTAHLSTEQHGAYCLMLMAAWKRAGSLPKDDSQLAAVCRLSSARWKAHRTVLLEFFTEEADQFSHKRVTAERQKAQAISDKKAQSGAKGGSAKAKNASKEGSEPHGKALANGVANAKQTSTPSPSPLPLPSEDIQPADAGLSTAEQPTLELVSRSIDEVGVPPCPHRRLLALFKAKVPELPQPRAELWEGSQGAEAMRNRWTWLLTAVREGGERYATTAAQGIEWFGAFFDNVASSDFLSGRSGKWTGCDLAWLMKRANFEKVVQGNYNRERTTA